MTFFELFYFIFLSSPKWFVLRWLDLKVFLKNSEA